MDRPPPPRVLEAFGREGRPRPVLGGQRPLWRTGDVIFKPLDMPAAGVAWQRRVLARAASNGLRVAPPLPSLDGRLVVAGWTAWPWLAGETTTRWREVVVAGERLHAALADEPRPNALLDGMTDPWTRADRAAWDDTEAPGGEPAADRERPDGEPTAGGADRHRPDGEPTADPTRPDGEPTVGGAHPDRPDGEPTAGGADRERPAGAAALVLTSPDAGVAALRAARQPVDLPAQIVHRDLSGNVLAERGRPPAVIDLSPTWRPADWGLAIAAVDLATWHGGGDAPLADVAGRPQGVQLLVRAALFRLLCAHDRDRLAATAAAVLARLE